MLTYTRASLATKSRHIHSILRGIRSIRPFSSQSNRPLLTPPQFPQLNRIKMEHQPSPNQTTNPTGPQPFSPAMMDFLASNHLPIELFTSPPELNRFIRLNPRRFGRQVGINFYHNTKSLKQQNQQNGGANFVATSSDATCDGLQAEFGTPLYLTPLPMFRSLDSKKLIADKELYKSGGVYGMDLASGVSVWALDPQPGDHVLDLCAAPGNKLAMIGDLIAARTAAVSEAPLSASSSSPSSSSPSSSSTSSTNFTSSVTGVDWNYQRLAAARTLMRKYELVGQRVTNESTSTVQRHVPLMRFFLADGQTFHQPIPTSEELSSSFHAAGHIIDLTQQTSAVSSSSSSSSSLPLPLASSASYHCSTASNSSLLTRPDGSIIRLNKAQKRAIKKQTAREEWAKKQKLENGAAQGKEANSEPQTSESPSESPSSSHIDSTSLTHASSSPSSSSIPPLSTQLYDRVLVDAECTHDGSSKHIAKLFDPTNQVASSLASSSSFAASDWSSFESKFLDPDRLASLQTLQRNLILNGFRLLRPGGVMIYSTCSYARRQNEEIVSWLIDQHPEAETVDVFDGVGEVQLNYAGEQSSTDAKETLASVRLHPTMPMLHYRKGQLATPATSSRQANSNFGIRLDPIVSSTSGLYIAKIRKRIESSTTQTDGDQQ